MHSKKNLDSYRKSCEFSKYNQNKFKTYQASTYESQI